MAISAYLGGKDRFDEAIADFAAAYAEKTEKETNAYAQRADQGRLARPALGVRGR